MHLMHTSPLFRTLEGEIEVRTGGEAEQENGGRDRQVLGPCEPWRDGARVRRSKQTLAPAPGQARFVSQFWVE